MRKAIIALASGLLAAALSAGQAAQAQRVSADDVISADPDREIVVTAKPDPPPKVDAARSQARMITDASNIYDEPLPLFQDRVCPGVSGLPSELAEYVADRIRYNAEHAGLKLAEAGACTPNLLVAFVLDGRKVLNDFDKKGHTILASVPTFERRELLSSAGPVHAFVISQHRTHTGMKPKFDPKQQYEVINADVEHSLFLLPTRSDIQISVVVIDIAAIDGMSVKQIADYATMRGLARTRPVAGDSTYGTILGLFDPDAGHPAELTTFDIAYLKALYSNVPNIAAVAKLGAVKYQMRKALEAAKASSNE